MNILKKIVEAAREALRPKWYLYGDLTIFWDRWGAQHTRLIRTTRTWVGAWIAGHMWIDAHPHGSAFISRRSIPEEELNPT